MGLGMGSGMGTTHQGKSQLLSPAPPAPPYYPFPRGKIHTRVIYGVSLWADMNAATQLGAWGRSVTSLAAAYDNAAFNRGASDC